MKQANIIKLFNNTRQTWTNWKNEKKTNSRIARILFYR
jgi:hypothetical protein